MYREKKREIVTEVKTIPTEEVLGIIPPPHLHQVEVTRRKAQVLREKG